MDLKDSIRNLKNIQNHEDAQTINRMSGVLKTNLGLVLHD